MKNSVIVVLTVLVLALSGVALYFFLNDPTSVSQKNNEIVETPNTNLPATTTDSGVKDENPKETVIGKSADGNPIIAYHYGEGDREVLFVGGVHGGYSWNTALLAYELIDYLEEDPGRVPDNLRVTVIPVLNPDGLKEVVGTTSRFASDDVPASATERIAGRFNGNNVDLNRNFDCDWKSEGTWQTRKVSGGSAAFSEPEAAAFRDYVNEHDPKAAVVWYSSAGGVFASNCHGSVLAETSELTDLYAKASGYKAYQQFNFYEITGDMVNWLAKEGIPAISVLLTTHEETEWSKNRAGIEALLTKLSE